MFKWKTTHTIDVQLEKPRTLGSWDVLALQSRKRVLISGRDPILSVDGKKLFVKIIENIHIKDVNETAIVECSMEIDDCHVSLFPIMIRDDKNYPNSVSTINSTVENVMESISIEFLLQALTTTV